MNRPNLLIAGAPKCGTSSLFKYLSQHPNIFMSDHKEPHFFVANECKQIEYDPWIKNEDQYFKLFDNAGEQQILGEGSVMYLTLADIAIPNIIKYLSEDTKIILLLRNPIERAISAYKHMKRSNPSEHRSFLKAIDGDEGNAVVNHPLMLYKSSGLYYENVKSFQESFKAVKVLKYEKFFSNTEAGMNEIWDFLGVKQFDGIDYDSKYNTKNFSWKYEWLQKLFINPNRLKKYLSRLFPFIRDKKNKTLIKSFLTKKEEIEIEQEAIAKLVDYYKDDIAKLSNLLSVDLSDWTVTNKSE